MNSKLKVGERMTTPKRAWYEGAAYHITVRGTIARGSFHSPLAPRRFKNFHVQV